MVYDRAENRERVMFGSSLMPDTMRAVRQSLFSFQDKRWRGSSIRKSKTDPQVICAAKSHASQLEISIEHQQ